ncbi:MAG: MBL fold metallo-hydrolase [Cytophagales bacterium]|nr:MAG: MBL fold metallo-hydrolase [Cytophagales bacterium]
MKIHAIDTGYFKLDGGAMFGVVPKSIWNKTNPADDNNKCTWAMRCLLIEEGNKLILIDNGIGNKQPESFFKHFDLHATVSIEHALNRLGYSLSDVTDNILTHLHFDHCGGGTVRATTNNSILPVFPNAKYWVHEQQWDWAIRPNPREKASFLSENLLPIQESGQLYFLNQNEYLFNNLKFHYVDGHTEKQTIPYIHFKNKTIVFAADLLPSTGHIPLPYVMGYDTRPLLTMEEKALFLKDAAMNDYIIFLQHDPIHQCCSLVETEKGVRLKETFSLEEIF